MSEKKKEEKNEKKKLTAFDEIGDLSSLVTAAYEAQQSILGSGIFTQISEMSKIANSQVSEVINSINSFNGVYSVSEALTQIMNQYQDVINSIELPSKMIAQTISGLELDRISKEITNLNEMLKLEPIDIPEISNEIKNIPINNNKIINILGEKIEFLEKQLDQKDDEIQKLRALLEDNRKELRKQYVS